VRRRFRAELRQWPGPRSDAREFGCPAAAAGASPSQADVSVRLASGGTNVAMKGRTSFVAAAALSQIKARPLRSARIFICASTLRPTNRRRWAMPETAIDVKKTPARRESAPDVWRSFRSEIDRLFDRFDGGFRLPSMRRMFDLEPFWSSETSIDFNVPAVDVAEDDKAYTITAELPGLDEKNIEVSVSGDRLVLKGEKRHEKEEKKQNYYLSERSYGSFQRSFRLPDGIDQDKVAATFAKGILTVTLPKTAEAQKQQKKIEVKAA
jgi:HSP20 family protein